MGYPMRRTAAKIRTLLNLTLFIVVGSAGGGRVTLTSRLGAFDG